MVFRVARSLCLQTPSCVSRDQVVICVRFWWCLAWPDCSFCKLPMVFRVTRSVFCQAHLLIDSYLELLLKWYTYRLLDWCTVLFLEYSVVRPSTTSRKHSTAIRIWLQALDQVRIFSDPYCISRDAIVIFRKYFDVSRKHVPSGFRCRRCLKPCTAMTHSCNKKVI